MTALMLLVVLGPLAVALIWELNNPDRVRR